MFLLIRIKQAHTKHLINNDYNKYTNKQMLTSSKSLESVHGQTISTADKIKHFVLANHMPPLKSKTTKSRAIQYLGFKSAICVKSVAAYRAFFSFLCGINSLATFDICRPHLKSYPSLQLRSVDVSCIFYCAALGMIWFCVKHIRLIKIQEMIL